MPLDCHCRCHGHGHGQHLHGTMSLMTRWRNFSVWRGRLPHWRADDVCYFVTFRHRRALEEDELAQLFSALVKPQGRWRLDLLCVLPDRTDLLVRVEKAASGQAYELSDIVERAKRKAGKAIIKASGERFPPFYGESYDRIVRDDAEMETTWEKIVAAAEEAAENSSEYRFLWVGVAD